MARELLPDETVANWRIVRRLADGGFGTVYEVRHMTTARRAALKVLHAHLVAEPDILARFDREIRVIERVRHPNVVELVDAGFFIDGRPYLCMELLDGTELAALIETRGRMSPRDALVVLQPLCEALSCAHDQGVIHRDVKAANVFVCTDGRVVLLDFGIAKLSDALAPELTATQQSIGTPSTMAPEQIYGRAVSPRTDVYALGALLFHMVTGRQPFEDASPTMTQYLHLHARRPKASALASVPAGLDDVIIRAMSIKPDDRFADVSSLLAAVRSALAESPAAPASDVRRSAILVAASTADPVEHDAALFDDLEGLLPAAERWLAGRAYQLGLELGASAVFVHARATADEAIADALALADHLAVRPARDDRVRVGVCVHAGTDVLRLEAWSVPDRFEGVWVTSAADPSSPSTKRVKA